ncbi:hypothetical protein [Gayadomonas joobiniege]|uniref:hypothetical protein n=1 Tax=Gayadomonas joobiniege TaxID=1234606 RepID=UPI00037F4305|nr:hypothetical protein [Gayadomonas joobiniege]
MLLRGKWILLSLLIVLNFNVLSYAKDRVANTPRERLMECFPEQQAVAQAQRCVGACRVPENASQTRQNRCLHAYYDYRKAVGKSIVGLDLAAVESFQLDQLIATFSVRNGRINQFKLVGEQSKLAKRAAKVCSFKLPSAQNKSFTHFHRQFNEQIRAFRQQGKQVAYKLSDIRWSEDGTKERYLCQIGQISVVAI